MPLSIKKFTETAGNFKQQAISHSNYPQTNILKEKKKIILVQHIFV